ncbi:hypothetical protein ACF1BE_26565 [Streptomyces sp. NPDC014991]|uniref:hypothetical protein n=1 Tax=Streptomyces sp. NPDC014991 TaxID=3364935 RepID=UPI0036F5D325
MGDAGPSCGPGTDHDHPGPLPDRDYAELVGRAGGLLLDITGWAADEIQTGVALMTEPGQFGVVPVGPRTTRAPVSGTRWDWSGDTP